MSEQKPIIDWNNSFDTTTSLAALYLWVMLGAIYTLLNCDLQRALNSNILAKHITGIIAFFFLFNIVDPNNKSHIVTTLLKTFVVYTIFLMATKSKLPYIILSLALLFVDQILRNHVNYLQNVANNRIERYNKARKYIQIAILCSILIGFLHYLYRQKMDYGDKFSFYKFFLGTSVCAQKIR